MVAERVSKKPPYILSAWMVAESVSIIIIIV